jgi:hypothetical protein
MLNEKVPLGLDDSDDVTRSTKNEEPKENSLLKKSLMYLYTPSLKKSWIRP